MGRPFAFFEARMGSAIDRMAVARYYLQAEMYAQAQQELQSIAQDFPELADYTCYSCHRDVQAGSVPAAGSSSTVTASGGGTP